MSEDAALVGDSSMHTGQEPAPQGGFFLHRMTIRFSSGEVFSYVVREPLHAEDIPPTARFAVIHSYMCETEEKCTEIILLNLNDISYIRTEHMTEQDLRREEEAKTEHRAVGTRQPLSHIGFI